MDPQLRQVERDLKRAVETRETIRSEIGERMDDLAKLTDLIDGLLDVRAETVRQ